MNLSSSVEFTPVVYIGHKTKVVVLSSVEMCESIDWHLICSSVTKQMLRQLKHAHLTWKSIYFLLQSHSERMPFLDANSKHTQQMTVFETASI